MRLQWPQACGLQAQPSASHLSHECCVSHTGHVHWCVCGTRVAPFVLLSLQQMLDDAGNLLTWASVTQIDFHWPPSIPSCIGNFNAETALHAENCVETELLPVLHGHFPGISLGPSHMGMPLNQVVPPTRSFSPSVLRFVYDAKLEGSSIKRQTHDVQNRRGLLLLQLQQLQLRHLRLGAFGQRKALNASNLEEDGRKAALDDGFQP